MIRLDDRRGASAPRRCNLADDRYEELHAHIAICPESGIYPRNGQLWSKVLYRRQNAIYEIVHLLETKEQDLKECRRRVPAMTSHVGQPSDEAIETIEAEIETIHTDLETSLVAYSKCLCLASQVAALPDPLKYIHKVFRHVAGQCDKNGLLPEVYGSSGGDIHRDCCAIKGAPEMDTFSSFVLFHILPWLAEHRHLQRFFSNKSSKRQGVMAGNVLAVTHVIASVMVALFNAGSIASLYFVKSMVARLIIITALLLALALAAKVFTTSSRTEMIIFLPAWVLESANDFW